MLSSFYLDLIDFKSVNQFGSATKVIASQQERASRLRPVKRCNISWLTSDNSGLPTDIWPRAYGVCAEFMRINHLTGPLSAMFFETVITNPAIDLQYIEAALDRCKIEADIPIVVLLSIDSPQCAENLVACASALKALNKIDKQQPLIETDLLIVLTPGKELPRQEDVMHLLKQADIRELSYRIPQEEWLQPAPAIKACLEWIVDFETRLTADGLRFGGLLSALRNQRKRLKPSSGQDFTQFLKEQISRVASEGRAFTATGMQLFKFDAIGPVYAPFDERQKFVTKRTQQTVSRLFRQRPQLPEDLWAFYTVTGFGQLAFERFDKGGAWVSPACPIGADLLFDIAKT